MSTEAATTAPSAPVAPSTPAPAVVAEPAKPKSAEASIQDAVDALFAKSEPKTETPAPAAETPAEPAEAAPEAQAETPAEEPKLPEVPATSASDYALKLERIKKREKASAQLSTSANADAMKRAMAIEAAGGDPIKAFEAAGFDLATIVQAYEKKREEDPTNADPLAAEVKQLRAMLTEFAERESARSAEAATGEFFGAAKEIIASSEGKYEYVAAFGEEGLDLVKELVLQSARQRKSLPLHEALQLAEDHFEAQATKLRSTKKLASHFAKTEPAKKPSIPAQAPVTTTAPAAPTKPRTIEQIIMDELDARMGPD